MTTPGQSTVLCMGNIHGVHGSTGGTGGPTTGTGGYTPAECAAMGMVPDGQGGCVFG